MPDKITLAVSRIQVGGRNYLLSKMLKVGGWSANNYDLGNMGFPAGYMYVIASKPGLTVRRSLSDVMTDAAPLTGKTAMFSFELSLSYESAGSFTAYLDAGSPQRATFNATKYYRRYSFRIDNFQGGSFVLTGLTAGQIYNLRNFKLELGNAATDYSTAPEETESALEDLSAKIKLIPGQIDLSVNGVQRTDGRNLYNPTSCYPSVWAANGASVPAGNLKATVTGFNFTGISGGSCRLRIPNVITDNGWWTVSFDVSSNSNYDFFVDICDLGRTPFQLVENGTKHVELSVNVTNCSSTYNFVDIEGIGYVHFNVSNLKVEKGNKGTPYSKYYKDVYAGVFGRNLIKNSSNFSNTDYWITNGRLAIEEETGSGYNWNGKLFHLIPLSTGGSYAWLAQSFAVTSCAKRDFVLSFIRYHWRERFAVRLYEFDANGSQSMQTVYDAVSSTEGRYERETFRVSLKPGTARVEINFYCYNLEYKSVYLTDMVFSEADAVLDAPGKDDIISSINMSPEEIKINASKIRLEGYTTINGSFHVAENGDVEMSGKFSSNKNGERIVIDPSSRNIVGYNSSNQQNFNLGFETVDGYRFPHMYLMGNNLQTRISHSGLEITDINNNHVEMSNDYIELRKGGNYFSVNTGGNYLDIGLLNLPQHSNNTPSGTLCWKTGDLGLKYLVIA